MANVAMVEAVTMALAWEMAHDDSVVVLGEDVGINGGVFRATAGLAQRFGDNRVIDTPLAETMIAGLTIGMAAQGMKPVAEAQFMGFIYAMVDHMICHAARMRHRTRGRLSCPMVSARTLRRRHSRPGAPLGEYRGDVCAHARAAGRDPLLAEPCLRPAAGLDPRSGSGAVP